MGVQLGRAALLGHNSARQHHHLIRTSYGAHPVGDDEDGFVFYQPGQSLLNGSFVLHIQTGSCLVQQDDGRILQEGAGDGNALTLATGKSAASSTESMRASASATTILLSLMYIIRVKVREITGVMMI